MGTSLRRGRRGEGAPAVRAQQGRAGGVPGQHDRRAGSARHGRSAGTGFRTAASADACRGFRGCPRGGPVPGAGARLRLGREKAHDWLRRTYRDPVRLVHPDPADEMPRGWFFACNTEAFLDGGDWRHAMVDAAVVVPKDVAEPFCLPNSQPWQWLQAWNQGAEPGASWACHPVRVTRSGSPGR
nr:YrhB family protein [Streptomyces sp. GC420]